MTSCLNKYPLISRFLQLEVGQVIDQDPNFREVVSANDLEKRLEKFSNEHYLPRKTSTIRTEECPVPDYYSAGLWLETDEQFRMRIVMHKK